MFRLFKIILVLLVFVAAAVVGYAYLGDISPEQDDRSVPVELDAG